jgi:ankyrin repeat protein
VVQDGWTPLLLAAQHCNEAAIKALVAAKADVHATLDVRILNPKP